jgi:hypothetical protein
MPDKIERVTEPYTDLPSAYQIGELVNVTTSPKFTFTGFIRAVTFTSSKVRYAVWIEETQTTLHNIDSVYVEPVRPREFILMPPDNYS